MATLSATTETKSNVCFFFSIVHFLMANLNATETKSNVCFFLDYLLFNG